MYQDSTMQEVLVAFSNIIHNGMIAMKRIVVMSNEPSLKPFMTMNSEPVTVSTEQIEAALSKLVHHREKLKAHNDVLLSSIDEAEHGLRELLKG